MIERTFAVVPLTILNDDNSETDSMKTTLALTTSFTLAASAAFALPSDHLVTDGSINIIEDDAGIFLFGSDSVIDVGDFIGVAWRATALEAPAGTLIKNFPINTGDETFTAAMLMRVDSIEAGNLLTLGTATGAEWTSMTGLSPTASDTMAILYDDPDNITNGADFATMLSEATNGSMLWEFGFDGSTDLSATMNISGGLDLTTYSFFDEVATIDISLNSLTTGANVSDLDLGLFSVPTGQAEFRFQGRALSFKPEENFMIADGDIALKPTQVPEPASFVSLGSLLALSLKRHAQKQA